MKQTILLILAATLFLSSANASTAQTSRKRMPPKRVVSDLYRQHKKRSPFFQRTNRALVDRYFTMELGDLIWKDAKGSGDEVGALDGDPLFNAQDMEIKKFAIHKADYVASADASTSESPREATVTASFENFGQPHSIYFEMKKSAVGWKISDIRYDDGAKLSVILKQ